MSQGNSKKHALMDTGVLVAAYARNDPLHHAATKWLSRFSGQIHTVEAVLVEACHFLPARFRFLISELVTRKMIELHQPSSAGYQRIGELFQKYVDLDPDWADVALVWLAEEIGVSRIATVNVADFSVYRINGRKRFELELLRS